jgi:hypothetical protein
MLIGGKFHSTSQTHKGEEEKKCEEKYKNIKKWSKERILFSKMWSEI